jgi:hypothetical protein
MRDINDPAVKEIAEAAFWPILADHGMRAFKAIEKHFGTVESWGNLWINTGALTYNLESGGKVTIRVVVETEGV